MGIPAAFRWLSTKYPKIISPVVEEQPRTMDDGTPIPVDTTQPNPNGEEFDNLYLDMNGIVHPCSHPEDRPAPKDEEEMMLEIFKYTDRVVNMVRPRKLLMIAVDGVAPRAKMNQQRSRRFRSAQEAKEKEADKEELLKLLKKQNGGGSARIETLETVTKKAFDSNSITPGTPFMEILATSLRYWCAYKLNTDAAWAKMKIIISDATIPGEGEHKIMSFIRSQRASPDHDPNTRHVIYGLDADLIMLGLATHEPHFRVLREDVFFQEAKVKMCKICGQAGHDSMNCKGDDATNTGGTSERVKSPVLKPFIWLHVAVLREYLAQELDLPGLPFRFDLERAIDDWVFLCFFVGNDFLPHLPALEIRENGIQTLMTIWKENLPHMGGYVTKDGHVDLQRAQLILNGLAKQEDAIFKRRREVDERREANNKRKRLNDGKHAAGGTGDRHQRRNRPKTDNPADGLALFSVSHFPREMPKAITHDMVMNRGATANANVANKSAADILKEQIRGLSSQPGTETPQTSNAGTIGFSQPLDQAVAPVVGKRKAATMEEQTSNTGSGSGVKDDSAVDTVRLWEDGYADRYYQQKFHVDPNDISFRRKVAHAYVEGLAWVLMYYFQGCPSWEWYYPYHYAPFAADFVDLDQIQLSFNKGRISKPFEQLMSVLPAASRHAIPEVFHDLMTNPVSEIIDFYPEDFEVDLNGKKMAWQGIALLPFIDMPRLLAAMEKVYHLLSPEDAARNYIGRDVLLISEEHHDLYNELITAFYSKKQGTSSHKLNPKTADGLAGTVDKISGYLPHGPLLYPLDRKGMPDLEFDRSLSVFYEFPTTTQPHKSMLLRGVRLPTPILNSNDKAMIKSLSQRESRGYGGVPSGRNSFQHGDRFSGRGSGGGQRRPKDYHSSDRWRSSEPTYQPANSFPPPPPGYPGFGVGIPPPPPLAYHSASTRQGPSFQWNSYNDDGRGRDHRRS